MNGEKINLRNLKNTLNERNNIKDSNVFNIEKLPNENLIFERKNMIDVFTPMIEFLELGIRKQLLVYGSVGSGKSHLINYAINRLYHEKFNFKHYYINCREHKTTYAIIKELLQERRRIPKTTLYDTFSKLFKKEKTVIVLDEIDLLQDDDILYSLFGDHKFSNVFTVLITNKYYFYESLSNDVKSRFNFDTVVFDVYNASETKEILKKRCEVGLKKYDSKMINLISALTTKNFNSDLRIAIMTLQRIFKNIDYKKYESENIIEFMQLERIKIQKKIIQSLNENKLIILYLISELANRKTDTPCRSDLLYRSYLKNGNSMVKSYFFQNLEELTKLDLISVSSLKLGRITVKEIYNKLTTESILKVAEILGHRRLI